MMNSIPSHPLWLGRRVAIASAKSAMRELDRELARLVPLSDVLSTEGIIKLRNELIQLTRGLREKST